MAWTKRQLAEAAFREIGIASYNFDIQPQELISAIASMDSMIANWGLSIRYNMSGNPDTSEPDLDSGLPIYANEAVYTNLGINLCPSYGKNPTRELILKAAKSLATLQMKVATIPQRHFDETLPYGQGNKPYVGVAPTFFQPTEQLTDDNGAPLL
jgi:hypothetical protein